MTFSHQFVEVSFFEIHKTVKSFILQTNKQQQERKKKQIDSHIRITIRWKIEAKSKTISKPNKQKISATKLTKANAESETELRLSSQAKREQIINWKHKIGIYIPTVVLCVVRRECEWIRRALLQTTTLMHFSAQVPLHVQRLSLASLMSKRRLFGFCCCLMLMLGCHDKDAAAFLLCFSIFFSFFQFHSRIYGNCVCVRMINHRMYPNDGQRLPC